MADAAGPLIIIGGHEDKEDQRVILKAVAERLNGGRLVIATVASHTREGYFDSYVSAFGALGVTDLVELYVEDRSQEEIASAVAVLDGAAGLFFTGGDQLRLSSLIGRTAVETRIQALHAAGGVVAGTSAGASAMSETMLVKGASKGSYRIGELHMAPGLGLLGGVIIAFAWWGVNMLGVGLHSYGFTSGRDALDIFYWSEAVLCVLFVILHYRALRRVDIR